MESVDYVDKSSYYNVYSEKPLWETLNYPKFILAPMIELGDLAFRMLTRNYGVHLVYSPALHSRLFSVDVSYRNKIFSTIPEEHPIIVQFTGNSPEYIVKASSYLDNHVSAVDINFGCPQGIAKRGHYGAYLLKDFNLVEHIVKETVRNCKFPVTCKLRKVSEDDLQSTLNLAKRLETVGCSAVCLHGRTINNKSQFITAADWNALAYLKKNLTIPGNGGIDSLEAAERCIQETNVDAVMSAEAILDYPALFSKLSVDKFTLMDEYIQLANKYSISVSTVKAHAFRMLYNYLQEHTDLRSALSQVKSIQDISEISSQLKSLSQKTKQNHLGWYWRHRSIIAK